MPRLFISYSWDDESHKAWVRDLAARLRLEGIETLLDQWHLVPGDQLPQFMETSVRESDFALIICTPRYKNRSDSRAGGVGYEGDIMTGEVFLRRNTRKFIPVLSRGEWVEAAPSWLQGKYYLDFRTTPPDDNPFNELVMTILGKRPIAPPVGIEKSIQIEALFLNQETFVVNPMSSDSSKGYSSFIWSAAYALQNTSGVGIMITRIVNIFPSVSNESHDIRLRYVESPGDPIDIYEDFRSFTDEAGNSIHDRLPYTLKPWTKVYVKVTSGYQITDRDQPLYCSPASHCYDLLTIALGASLNADGSRPGILK